MFYEIFGLLIGAIREFRGLSSDFSLWTGVAGLCSCLFFVLFMYLGRFVQIDYRSGLLPTSLAGLAIPLSFMALMLFPATAYLRPAVIKILAAWEVDFRRDEAWNQESFRRQYWAVRALKKTDGTTVEDFTNYPPPEKGGSKLPANFPESMAIISEIESTRVAQHFQSHLAFINKLLWMSERPLPEVLRQDMETFFRNHPGTPYSKDKAVQLAGGQMQGLLERKSERIVLTARIIVVSLLVLLWVPLYGWVVYDAWKKLEPVTE